MKRSFIYLSFFIALSFFSACDQANKTKELELRERELALKEKELEAKDNAPATTPANPTAATVKPSPKAEAPKAGSGQKTIDGDAVIMREGPTTESAKLGNFKKGEIVSVLEKKEQSTYDEMIASKSFTLTSSDGKKKVEVNKGAALKVKQWEDEGMGAVVSFKGIEGTIPAEYMNDTGIWYKIRRSDGKEGWVLGKFLK